MSKGRLPLRRKRPCIGDGEKENSSEATGTVVEYRRQVLKLRKTIPTWHNFFCEDEEDSRNVGWVRLEVIGQSLTEKFAWAVPDAKALHIIASFAPLVEMGAGKGYWASLLQKQGVDIIPLDKHVHSLTGLWTNVEKGCPKNLSKPALQNRALLLCYPDESDNVGSKCMKHFSGDIILHVGELITTGTLSGQPQAPFGRTSSSDFQVELCETFHCMLVHELVAFPFCKDYLTVWKRTKFVAGRDGDDGGTWASIPPEERLPLQAAAPCLQHLLQ